MGGQRYSLDKLLSIGWHNCISKYSSTALQFIHWVVLSTLSSYLDLAKLFIQRLIYPFNPYIYIGNHQPRFKLSQIKADHKDIFKKFQFNPFPKLYNYLPSNKAFKGSWMDLPSQEEVQDLHLQHPSHHLLHLHQEYHHPVHRLQNHPLYSKR